MMHISDIDMLKETFMESTTRTKSEILWVISKTNQEKSANSNQRPSASNTK